MHIRLIPFALRRANRRAAAHKDYIEPGGACDVCNPWIDSLLLRILHIRMCWHPCGTSTTSGPGANERCATDSLLCASSFHLAQAQQTASEKLCAFRSRSPPRIAPKPSNPSPSKVIGYPSRGAQRPLALRNEWAFHANRFLSVASSIFGYDSAFQETTRTDRTPDPPNPPTPDPPNPPTPPAVAHITPSGTLENVTT